MHRTIFNTPILTPLLRQLARLLLRLHGWRVACDQSALKLKKYVLVGAPHTSNWDGYYFILAALKLKLTPQWMGKDKLFKFPLGGTMRWFGGIAVDRSQANNLVQATADEFKRRESLVVAVPPEGTRGRRERWKTGFFYIARGAAVPVVCGFIDYARKELGLGPVMQMGENLNAELVRLGEYYAEKTGKYPALYTSPV